MFCFSYGEVLTVFGWAGSVGVFNISGWDSREIVIPSTRIRLLSTWCTSFPSYSLLLIPFSIPPVTSASLLRSPTYPTLSSFIER